MARLADRPNSNLDISVRRVDGDTVVRPLLAESYGEDSPALSPDSRWLAYSSNETGQWELYVRPFPDVTSWKKQVSTSGGSEAVWSPNGRELFYRNGDGQLIAVEVIDAPTFTAGRQEVLFSMAEFLTRRSRPLYNVTADGQRFVMLKTIPARPDRLILVQNFVEELKAKVGGNR